MFNDEFGIIQTELNDPPYDDGMKMPSLTKKIESCMQVAYDQNDDDTVKQQAFSQLTHNKDHVK